METSTQDNDSNTVYKKYSLLNLVDLAGSERVNKDENNNTNNETGYINKSLFALANVINKLSENKNIHIPYRDSKLTRLLSVALGGGSLVNIICNISPSASNYFQTVSTLRFANRAKNIKIKPAINEKIIRKYNEKHRTINFYNTSNNYYINRNNLINQRNKSDLFKDYEDDTSNNNLESINYNGTIDYQRKYYELLLKNKELISENNKLKSTVENFMELNKSNNNSEMNFIDRCIEKIKFLILKTNNSKEINQYINNNLKELKMNYINQLKSIQNLYLSKINELQNAIMTNLSNNTKDNEKSDNETDNENNFELFSEIDLDFGHVNDIKDVKLIYENKEQQLEQLMTKYKESTDLYFVNLLKNSNDKKNISELYKERMSELENLYEKAQNQLEKNFFKKLREITDFIKQNNH